MTKRADRRAFLRGVIASAVAAPLGVRAAAAAPVWGESMIAAAHQDWLKQAPLRQYSQPVGRFYDLTNGSSIYVRGRSQHCVWLDEVQTIS